MTTQRIVYIVDDEAAICAGLVMVLKTFGFECKAFNNAESFLEQIDANAAGCLLLDLNLPGLNGDELQMILNQRNINMPIIFLTAYADIPTTVRTVKAGAVDVLTKPVSSKLLIERLMTVFKDNASSQFPSTSSTDNGFLERLKSLTSREMEVLPFALAGLPNKEIANKLGISYRTVEVHRIRILKKTNALNFLELAKSCEQNKVKLIEIS